MLGLGVKIPEVASRRKGVGGGGGNVGGGPGPRYWQFQVLTNNGHSQSFVQRLELYDEALNVNRAYDATVTGDGSAGSFPPSALNNQALPVPITGNDYWKDEVSTPVTLDAVFDFGVNGADIRGFGLLTPGLSANWAIAAPNSMKLRSSPDNATWTDVIVPAAQTGWAGYNGEHRQFYKTGVATENVSYGAHRYWRLLFLANFGNVHFVTAAVEFRETRGGPNVATGGTATANSTFDATYLAPNAFDGNFDTAWHSANQAEGAWIKYDFGVGVTKNIREVFIMGRNEPSFAPNQTPHRAVLQFSDDDIKWHTAFPFRSTGDAAFGGSFDTRVFSDPRFPAPGAEVCSLSATDKSANAVVTGDSVVATAATLEKVRGTAPIYGKKVWLGRLPTTLTGNWNFGLASKGWRIASGTTFLGGDGGGQSASIVENGQPYLANQTAASLTTFVASDIVMCAFDPDTGKVWFGKNGTWFGNPAAGTGQATTMTSLIHKQWFPAWACNAVNMGVSYCFDGLPKIARTNFLAIASGDIPAAPTGFSYFAAP